MGCGFGLYLLQVLEQYYFITIKYIIPTTKLKGEETKDKLDRLKKRKNR